MIEAIGNNQPIIAPGAFNVVKFALSWISIVYNIIFFVQHYCIYGDKSKSKQNENKESDDKMEGRNRALSVSDRNSTNLNDNPTDPLLFKKRDINNSSKNESLTDMSFKQPKTIDLGNRSPNTGEA